MHHLFRRLFPLIVLAALFTGCTIEKRLYTKGWSVSSHRSWKQQKDSGPKQQAHPAEDAVVYAPETKLLQDEPSVPVSQQAAVIPDFADSSVNETAPCVIAATESEEVTDTIFIDEKDIKKQRLWTQERKRNAVATVSVLLLLIALSIVAFLLAAYAPSAAIVESILLILLTGVFGMLFLILLVMLLVFATRRPVDKPVKSPEEMTPKEKRNQEVKNWILLSIVIAAGIVVVFKLFNP